MKKVFLSIVALAALVVLPMTLNAANTSESLTGTGKAKIIESIAMSKGTTSTGTGATDLDFGTVSISGDAGTVTVDAASAANASASGVSTVGTGQTAANFTISGQSGASVTITSPSSITVNGPSSSTMSIAPTCSLGAGTSHTATLTGGSVTFYIGGTLSVGATQTTGDYTGTFNITAMYNWFIDYLKVDFAG